MRSTHVLRRGTLLLSLIAMFTFSAGARADEPPPIKGDAPLTTLWSGKSLSDWGADDGGGLYTSGTGTGADALFCHSAAPCVQLQTIYPFSGSTPGARLFRWNEAREHLALFYSAWIYIPFRYTLTGPACCGQYWNLFQFKTVTEDRAHNDPLWAFYVATDSDGQLYLQAGWGWGSSLPQDAEGPYACESGPKFYEPRERVPLPVRRWVHLTAYLQQNKRHFDSFCEGSFNGHLKFWQDDTLLFDFRNVRTSYTNCTYNIWCSETAWSVNLYSDGLSPSPASLYVDDAEIDAPE